MGRIFRYVFVTLIISFLFYWCFLKEEINCGLRDTLDHRHELIDSLYQQLDSLHKVIDTLQYENPIHRISIFNGLASYPTHKDLNSKVHDITMMKRLKKNKLLKRHKTNLK